jgi:hypothetical protein
VGRLVVMGTSTNSANMPHATVSLTSESTPDSDSIRQENIQLHAIIEEGRRNNQKLEEIHAILQAMMPKSPNVAISPLTCRRYHK